MSIMVKGAKMPNNCGACPLRLAWCTQRLYMITRPERCPLEPVRKGKWIPIQRGFFNKEVTQVKCDQCGNLLDLIGVNCGRGDANFCPNCGAMMSEGEENEKA